MTDNDNGARGGISRRRLLRTAGAGAGAAALGLTVSSAPAAANACPRPAAYWADGEWPETEHTDGPVTIVGEQRSVAAWKLRLSMAPEDAGRAMARQLVAARLNFQHRWKNDADCVDAPLPAYGGRTMREIRREAKYWLAASDWPSAQDDWVVGDVDGEPLWEALRAFNEARFDELDCHCSPLRRDYESMDVDPLVDDTADDEQAKTAGRTDDRDRGPTLLPSLRWRD